MSTTLTGGQLLLEQIKFKADEVDFLLTQAQAQNKIMRAALWEISTSTATEEEAHDLVATAQGALHRANDA